LTHSSSAASGAIFTSALSQPPLDSIAEQLAGSGEETDDDDEEIDEAEELKRKPRKSSDDSVIKTGYLWKKGERRKVCAHDHRDPHCADVEQTWKKRWFVLRTAHLAYYKSSAEYQLLRMLELSEVHTCTIVSLKKHDNTFGIVSPTRTFYLQAKTQDEVQAWVKAINVAVEVVRLASTQGTSSTTSPIPIPTNNRAPVPSTPSPSRSHGVTSSDSDDGSPSGPRSYSLSTPNAGTSPKPTALGAKDPVKPLLSGYLMKCGSKRRIWHHRWFVLSGEKLTYSRSHMVCCHQSYGFFWPRLTQVDLQDSKTHREIPISLIIDALDFEVPGHRNLPISPPSHTHHQPPVSAENVVNPTRSTTFKIVTTKRTLILCAPSEEEEIKWLSAIRALIARRSEAGVVPGDSRSPDHHGQSGSVTKGKKESIARRLSLSSPVPVVVSAATPVEGPGERL
jgi:hypothetical protein